MTASSFPVGSSVLLQGLVGGAQYNDKKGIVRSPLKPTGRHDVYIFEANRTIAIKVDNMRYEPRELSTLSVSEMKGVLGKREEKELVGLGKDDLQKMIAEITTCPTEIAKLVAEANEPKETPPNNTATDEKNSNNFSATQLREASQKMASMSPDQLRQQAATMKAMGPTALRNLNPAMKHMSDAQINQAIEQMEAVANNPEMMRAATEQMKNMKPEELEAAVGAGVGGMAASSATTASSGSGGSLPNTIKNMTSSQIKEASQKMSSMSPDELRQQASMLKSMPLDTLRRTNPHFATMTEDQIKMAITQMEQMADNPDMMKLAAEQMKNMDEAQLESMKSMLNGDSLNGASNSTATPITNANNLADLAADPSKMMESLLSNPEQLSSMIKTMKQNPDLMKSVISSQMGINADGTGGDEAKKKQMEQAIDQFTSMDDAQLEKLVKVANTVQKFAKPVLTSFNGVKNALGVSAKTLIVLLNLLFFGGIGVFIAWRRTRGDVVDGVGEMLGGMSEEIPEVVGGYDDGEF